MTSKHVLVIIILLAIIAIAIAEVSTAIKPKNVDYSSQEIEEILEEENDEPEVEEAPKNEYNPLNDIPVRIIVYRNHSVSIDNYGRVVMLP